MNHRQLCKNKRIIATIISSFVFITMFFISYSTANDYGYTWDEPLEQNILQENMKVYAMRFLPEFSKTYQYYANSDIWPIYDSGDKDHGESLYYPVGLRMHERGLKENSEIWHNYSALCSFFGVIALFFIIKLLTNNLMISLFGALMYFFTPLFFAHFHYNNKDIVLCTLLLIEIAIFLRLIYEDKRNAFFAICAGVCAGFLANTRVVGMAFVLLLGLMYLVVSIISRKSWKSIVVVFVLGISVWILTYVAITPACWKGLHLLGDIENGSDTSSNSVVLDSIKSAQSFGGWHSTVLFEGRIHQVNNQLNELPWYYPIKSMIISSPIYVLFFSIIGHIFTVKNLFSKDNSERKKAIILLFIIVAWIAPMLYALFGNMVLFNGWRHIFFCYVPIIILAVYGIDCLWKIVSKHTVSKIVYGTVLAGIIIFFAAGIINNHPFQYGYYNILAGRNVEDNYEMDYWNVSIKDALLKCYENANETQFTVGGTDQYSRYGVSKAISRLEFGELISDIDLLNSDTWPDYIIENVTYRKMFSEEDIDELMNNYELIYTSKSYGTPLTNVYRCK